MSLEYLISNNVVCLVAALWIPGAPPAVHLHGGGVLHLPLGRQPQVLPEDRRPGWILTIAGIDTNLHFGPPLSSRDMYMI